MFTRFWLFFLCTAIFFFIPFDTNFSKYLFSNSCSLFTFTNFKLLLSLWSTCLFKINFKFTLRQMYLNNMELNENLIEKLMDVNDSFRLGSTAGWLRHSGRLLQLMINNWINSHSSSAVALWAVWLFTGGSCAFIWKKTIDNDRFWSTIEIMCSWRQQICLSQIRKKNRCSRG